MTNVAYKRVMLKISGEALSGANGFGFDFEVVGRIAREVKTLVDMAVTFGEVEAVKVWIELLQTIWEC